MLRRLLFGSDDGLVYDQVNHAVMPAWRKSLWWRFCWRWYWSSPCYRWTMEWDARFRSRYLDRGGCFMERMTAQEFYQ